MSCLTRNVPIYAAQRPKNGASASAAYSCYRSASRSIHEITLVSISMSHSPPFLNLLWTFYDWWAFFQAQRLPISTSFPCPGQDIDQPREKSVCRSNLVELSPAKLISSSNPCMPRGYDWLMAFRGLFSTAHFWS
jgi:hypothetical protein